MNFNSFFEQVEERGMNLSFDNPPRENAGLLSNEALFHLPLLASIVLLLAKGRGKPEMSQIGQIVGECLERSFVSFKGSSQHIGWSGNLRMRTVRALTFLETAKLIIIDSQKKQITATAFGKKVIDTALNSDSDLSYTLKIIERSYRNIRAESQIEMDIL